MKRFLTKAFGFDAGKNSVRTEIIAGVTSFLTMAYILAVNPDIFSAIKEMPGGAVFTATALASIVGTLMMAFYAKKPYGQAPSMGLNAFFVYTVCLGMGFSWQLALTAILIEGILFMILSLTKVRESIVNVIPKSLRNAIGAGIGMFIALIGLKGGGIVVADESTLVTLGPLGERTTILFIIGTVLTSALVILKVRGGILIGMLATTLVGIPMGITKIDGVISTPTSISSIFCQFEWDKLFSWDMIIVVFTFLFIDMFNTIGTVVGVSVKSGQIDKNGKIDGISKILMADAVATTAGACFGTSTTTTYVESAAGVAEGGRTGLTAFVIAVCFAIALFFSPVFLAIPSAATSAVLVIVGVMMMAPVKNIDWNDYTEAIPAFLTMILMPLTYSIADGILIGMIAYTVINAISGKIKKLSAGMWILAILFVLKYIFI